MKRSKTAHLLLMGLAPIALTACDPDVPATVYDSVDSCKASGTISAEQCEASYAQAKTEHERVAPRYMSLADCEKDFGEGKCTAPSNAQPGMSSYIMPMMAGYMLSNALRRNDTGGGNSTPGFSQPLYRTQNSGYQTAGGALVAQAPGAVTVSKSATMPQARAITMSRAGFGSSMSSHSRSGG